MSETARYNGQIPTDPAAVLVLLLTLVYAAGQLTPDQTSALLAVTGIADAGMRLLHLMRGRR